MTIQSGTRLGPYEVIAPIGAGGMGEVYKANDTRLDRTVAIKVLPEHLAESPERKARFEREAKAISQLNHPHICTLYDVGEQDGIDFIVMEYIEGETLAERLKKGALKLDQALEYGIQIADGLDTAHRAGIVHRDLKPANAMLTKTGIKLLDFGLARLVEGDDASETSDAPTRQKDLTQEQSIIGTLQYMAPEQLEAKSADARTDIFAFGLVLYEMITGRRAFEGKSQASLISAIMGKDPPPISTVESMSPPMLDHVVTRCLAKEPDERWQTASDVMRELKWIAEGGSDAGVSMPVEAHGPNRGRFWGVAGLVVGALVTAMVAWNLMPPVEPPALTRFGIVLPSTQRLTGTGQRAVAFSPDGNRLAYIANDQLYLREMDQMGAVPIRETDVGSRSPFFSPDGEWIGFFASADTTLKKVSIRGGAPVTLCDFQRILGASWGQNDSIVFGQGTGIFRVSANGGTPEILVEVDAAKGEAAYGPQILPDGETLLFSLRTGASWDEAQIVVQSMETGERRVLIEGGADARYVSTGHLVYALGQTLLAVPFDLGRLEVTGGPVPVVEGVMRSGITNIVGTGAAQFSFSANGSLVFLAGSAEDFRLVWVDRMGVEEPLPVPPSDYRFPRLLPDGDRLAVIDRGDVWIHSIARGTSTRLTFTEDNNYLAWSPDGERVIFSSSRSGVDNLFWKSADGRDEAAQLTTSQFQQHPDSTSPDGRLLAFHEHGPTNSTDLWVVSLEGDGEPQPFLQTPFNERGAAFSPNGRWLAYGSDESGRNEVYVRPFPGPGSKYQISREGGDSPVWRRNGRELFYRVDQEMMVVDIAAERGLTAGTPRLLFEKIRTGGPLPFWDVAPGGERFVMRLPEERSSPVQLEVVLNWHEELKRLVPTSN